MLRLLALIMVLLDTFIVGFFGAIGMVLSFTLAVIVLIPMLIISLFTKSKT